VTDEIELTRPPSSCSAYSRGMERRPHTTSSRWPRPRWAVLDTAHSQLYAEPARLARAGYLTEDQEQGGRHRKRYSLADRGREALDDWLGALTPEPYVLRDVALLKLFFERT